MDFIIVPLVLFIIFGTLYKVIQLYATRRERILYIEKMTSIPSIAGEGGAPMPALPWATSDRMSRFTALRWSLLLIGLGLGMLVAFFTALAINPDIAIEPWNVAEEYGIILGASMLFFGGLGLLISFLIESRAGRR